MVILYRFLLLSIIFLPLAAIPALAQGDEITRAKYHYNLGRKFYRAGQTSQAIEHLYTALSVQELYFEAQFLLGRALIETKRYREAAATLKEIEPPDQDSVMVQKLLGKSYYEMNKLREASRHLIYAVGLSRRPDHELHYILGLVKFRQRDAQRAIEEAKIATTLKPRFMPAHKLLSDAYFMKGDYFRAEKALKRYLSSVRDRTEAAALKERINAYRSLGRAKPEKIVEKPILPPRVYRVPQPSYTEEALRYKVEGSVKIEVLFGSDGTIQHALVVRGLGFGLDEEALKAARSIKFKPGEVDGKPVSMWMGVVLIFSMEDGKRKQMDDHRIALND